MFIFDNIKTKVFILVCVFFIYSCSDESKAPGKEIKKPEEKDSLSPAKPLLHSQLSYTKIKKRESIELKNDSLKTIIDDWINEQDDLKIDALVDFLLDKTKDQLSFTFNKCSSATNTLVKTRKANCIGYAAFFNSLFNYAVKKKGLEKRYKCYHYVGKIYYAGQNVNALFNDPFFKDHDFNIIEDTKNKTRIALDPSIYEYLGVRRVSIKE